MSTSDTPIQVDITRDVCPMTQVKVKMALSAAPAVASLRVRLKDAALKNVIATLKADGVTIGAVERDGETFVLSVHKGAGTERRQT